MCTNAERDEATREPRLGVAETGLSAVYALPLLLVGDAVVTLVRRDALSATLGDVQDVRQALAETTGDPSEFVSREVCCVLDHRPSQAHDDGRRLDLLAFDLVGELGQERLGAVGDEMRGLALG